MKYEMKLTTRQAAMKHVYFGLFWLALVGGVVLVMSVRDPSFSFSNFESKLVVQIMGLGGAGIIILVVVSTWLKKGHWYVYIDEDIFVWEEPSNKNDFRVKLEEVIELVQVRHTPNGSYCHWHLNTTRGRMDINGNLLSAGYMSRIETALKKNKVKIRSVTEK